MKKILIIVGVLALLAVVALFAVRHFALGYLTPDFVARTIESRWNCRAEIGGQILQPTEQPNTQQTNTDGCTRCNVHNNFTFTHTTFV